MPVLNTLNATATNATSDALQVICAWPVSGQYGPGSRILYYILVAACVFARKAEWLRNACLAAALLFPAVAALHGIVLAAIHVNGAVDMDVYGAFQLCSLGILAGPVTVRLSKTYFNAPGRNIIFLWTGLVLAGLLSLTVEFFRIKTSHCTSDDSGKPFLPTVGQFPYGTATCGLTCSVSEGPTSPLRGGAQNNIYVIPAPDKLTFGTATILSAGCCIPAILYLVFMWNKILEINWKTRFGDRDGNETADEPIEGTNGATVEKMKGVNSLINLFLSAVEIPVFGAAVLAILILGERNFWSHQVRYQTEPIASIGQWAPIVGTGLAVLGSLYLLLAAGLADSEEEEEAKPNISQIHAHHCNCSMREVSRGRSRTSSHSIHIPSATDMRTSHEIVPTTTWTSRRSGISDAGNRRKVAKALSTIGNYLGNPSEDRFDDSEFKRGKAIDFPEIPGEDYRNSALPQIREQFNPDRDQDGRVTPGVSRQRSRTGSFNSRLNTEGRSSTERMPARRDTLEVPSPHHRPTWDSATASFITTTSNLPSSPTAVVSSGLNRSNPPTPTEPPATPATPTTAVFPPSP